MGSPEASSSVSHSESDEDDKKGFLLERHNNNKDRKSITAVEQV